jgi:hypothetical protein
MGGITAVPADIPQVDHTKRTRALSPEFDIRRYCFLYFSYQLIQDHRFHDCTRVHDITFHNVSVFIISKMVGATTGSKTLKESSQESVRSDKPYVDGKLYIG